MTARTGTCFLDRDQPPLSFEQSVRQFHHLYYQCWWVDCADTINLSLVRLCDRKVPA